MFFFLNDGINFNKSGIEHAQVKRLRLFKHHEVPARIVTRQFALNLHEITRDAGIDDDDFVNLFDFFQGTMTYEARNFTIEDLQLPDGYEYEPEGVEKLHVKEKGKQIMIIAKRGADDERLNWVQYLAAMAVLSEWCGTTPAVLRHSNNFSLSAPNLCQSRF